MMLTLAASGDSPDNDVAGLISRLAAERPDAELYFSERRESDLLTEPLTVTGRLWRDRQGRLIRETTEPHRERQVLTADRIEITRPGGTTRQISLRRAPELAVLYHALTGILAGDASIVDEHFTGELLDDDENGWRLCLRPRSPELADRVDRLIFAGRDVRISQLTLHLSDGETVHTRIRTAP